MSYSMFEAALDTNPWSLTFVTAFLRSNWERRMQAFSACSPEGHGGNGIVAASYKDGNIRAFSKHDLQRLTGSFGFVIFFQLETQTPSLASYDSVGLRIVIRRTAENRHPDYCFLQVDRIPTNCRLYDKGQKTYEFLRARKCFAVAKKVQRRANLLLRHLTFNLFSGQTRREPII